MRHVLTGGILWLLAGIPVALGSDPGGGSGEPPPITYDGCCTAQKSEDKCFLNQSGNCEESFVFVPQPFLLCYTDRETCDKMPSFDQFDCTRHPGVACKNTPLKQGQWIPGGECKPTSRSLTHGMRCALPSSLPPSDLDKEKCIDRITSSTGNGCGNPPTDPIKCCKAVCKDLNVNCDEADQWGGDLF